MNYWLVKSEPTTFSWDKFVKEGMAVWDGVRSYPGRKNLREMKKGDQVLFYHSMEGLEVVGIAEVSKEAYQDPTTTDDWSAVDLKPVEPLKKSVPLNAIREEKKLQNIYLIKQARLSVMPLQKTEFDHIVKMGS
ncbi:MAG: EVE domain-containing protein [Crocinitomicaceae bacterium]|jgi:predicted RNA-binding protein with PUA-like domain|nr:EVE domain-containing protein [Crocinitomicaceae bacterium]